MDVQAATILAKYIGAGLACLAMGGAAVGIGIIFGNYLQAAIRNPSAAQQQFGNLIFGFAVTEVFGIVGIVIAFLLLFAV
jgi:F-type H+-transporting ATPase subunit c